MAEKNYLLDHLRRDGRATVLFGIGFAALGLIPWLAMTPHRPEDAPLRFAGLAATACGLLAIGIARGAAADPMSHQSVLELARYGPIAEVLATLQRESQSATRLGKLCLSENWLTACGVGITVVRLDEIASVELGETKVAVNGVETGSNWRLVAETRDGRVLDFNCRNHEVAVTLLGLVRGRLTQR